MREGFRIVTSVFDWISGLYRHPERVRYPNHLRLSFEMQMQQRSNWCWAATASSISQYYEPDDYISQDEIVGRAFGFPKPWVSEESWNREETMLTGLRVVGCDSSTYPGSAELRQAMRQLDRGNPVCVQIKWPLTGGHAVVIHGCWLDENGEDHFLIGDPCFDYSFPAPGRELRNDYLEYGGRWVQTYHVRAPWK
ncbi:papain-like cysteine protease family protein [Rhizobium sp. YS-1r]|uniref:papain-like cysteine protease family protein n=1 Tax=Rhizobium sp. YS-1r TaxID=1532558 RepID=UPI00050FB092|nr:papain-like cysteine protease family protein [Rhizobium sp. YS-1r]KGD99617.1 hypothetical protein JL39_11455 [Rhizobium sp. YS-1r]